MRTDTLGLFEATTDQFFGAGIGYNSKKWDDRSWSGKNIAGKGLMKVRKILRQKITEGLNMEALGFNYPFPPLQHEQKQNVEQEHERMSIGLSHFGGSRPSPPPKQGSVIMVQPTQGSMYAPPINPTTLQPADTNRAPEKNTQMQVDVRALNQVQNEVQQEAIMRNQQEASIRNQANECAPNGVHAEVRQEVIMRNQAGTATLSGSSRTPQGSQAYTVDPISDQNGLNQNELDPRSLNAQTKSRIEELESEIGELTAALEAIDKDKTDSLYTTVI